MAQQFDEAAQRELSKFLEAEQAKARLQQSIHTFCDLAFDKCVTKIGNKLDRSEEACLANTVDRFLDTSLFIVRRLEETKGSMMVHVPYDCLVDIVTFLAQDPTFDAAVLMRVSREWFAISGPLLYAHPARRILLKHGEYQDALDDFGLLLDTLLHCTPFDPSLLYQLQLRPEYKDAPLLERLPTTNYLKWVTHLDRDWNLLQTEWLGNLSSKFAVVYLLRHHPYSVQHLTLDAFSVGEVFASSLVSGLMNVRSLELTNVESWEEAANALWFASALYAEHGSLQRFKMDARYHAQPLGSKPLDLAFLSSIRELNLGAWSGVIRLASLPTTHLRHLYIPFLPYYTVKQLGTLFDSCPHLESLAVHLKATQGFKWATLDNPANTRCQKRLHRLCSLHLKGNLLTLPPALEEALGIWGDQLESLTVELTGGLVENYRGQLQWSTPLPRLRRLLLMDKTVFALVGSSLQRCQNISYLMMHIDAEQSAFGCILPNPGLTKWIYLNIVFREMADSLKNLKVLQIKGMWINSIPLVRYLTNLPSLEQLLVESNLQYSTIEFILAWIKTMPRLRYALLPRMMARHPPDEDGASWPAVFERAGLALDEFPLPVGGKGVDNPRHAVLPFECLELIAGYLSQEMATMHSMLQASRALFYATIPLLYRDPFKLLLSQLDLEARDQRMAHLLRLFWRCSGQFSRKQVKQQPQQEFEKGGTYSSNSSGHDAEPCSSQGGRGGGGRGGESSATTVNDKVSLQADAKREFPNPTVDYLAHYTYQSLIGHLWASVQYLFETNTWSGRERLRRTAAIANRVFTTAFFEHRPNMIRTLCMSPAQLGLLVQRDEQGKRQGGGVVAGRGEGCSIADLPRLRRLELDISPSKSSVDLVESWHLSPFDNIPAPQPVEMNEIEIPLQFVQRHQMRFQGVLREIVVRGSDASWSPIDHLLRQVEPMHLVDFSAWNSPLPTFEQLPVAELRVLRLNMPRRLDWAGASPAFLRTCTKLCEVWMPTQHSTFFDQATVLGDETISIPSPPPALQDGESTASTSGEAPQSVGAAVGADDLMMGHWTEVAASMNIVGGDDDEPMPAATTVTTDTDVLPMRAIRLQGQHQHVVPNFVSALRVFRQLTECCIVENDVGRKAEYLQKIEWDWRMRHLTFLRLQGRFVFFLDLTSLLQCPLLSRLHLTVESAPRDPMQSHVVVLAQLKRLEEIQLRGMPWQLDTETLLAIGRGLSQTLRYLAVIDNMQPTTRGLAEFSHVATRLEVLKLGVLYSQVKDRLLALMRPRVRVVFSKEQ
ncbi:Mitochondrial import inner membrane translocase subunit tim8 [Actinomortierella ambigua]|uniref:Mitochondrial import inner membrane translocase subunit tim8 n=1 Tax=Actinomortierella ambigua TaxID=1343610 RepID=A0A9P6QK21_9FUNG|nr:Mitochondrial import inner membrane translocase subunit tim8 [Actinomortierella ambigua]